MLAIKMRYKSSSYYYNFATTEPKPLKSVQSSNSKLTNQQMAKWQYCWVFNIARVLQSYWFI